MDRFCGFCGAARTSENAFCTACGARLHPAGSPAPASKASPRLSESFAATWTAASAGAKATFHAWRAAAARNPRGALVAGVGIAVLAVFALVLLLSQGDGFNLVAPGFTTEEPLNAVEERLAGTWSRLHIRNRGYDNEQRYRDYVTFMPDRTTCTWSHGQRYSWSSSSSTFDYSTHGKWSIPSQETGPRYTVRLEGTSYSFVFDFAENVVHPSGFSSLAHSKTTAQDCRE